VPVPSIRGKLSDDLEAEINEALGGLSLDEVMGDRAAASGRLDNESRHRAQVVDIHGDNVFFSLGGKNQGVCSLRNFETPPEVGAMIDVIVTGYNNEDGLHDIAVPGGSLAATGADWSSIAEGSLVEAKISAANTGGLEATVNGIRAFIPASQISLFRTENLPDFVGQKMVCVVTEANERRGNLVLSRRAVLEREKEESKKQLLSTLQVGDMREGVVRKIHDFGAFCDLGGVDGLIHISQLSWDRVKHPSEVLKEGEKVRVRIEKLDAETGKISLSLRNLEEHPWTGIEKRFPVGAMVRGPVSRIAEFGAFVKLAPGVEGLIHISELAHHRVFAVKNIVKEGQEVEAKVISVDADAQRMSLSLKAAVAKPVTEADKKADVPEVDEPPRALAVPKRSGPLKGGIRKASGGDQFGLKW
jgi:small subunit ribosomal protein S1